MVYKVLLADGTVFIQPGKAMVLGRASSSPSLIMRKLMKKVKPGFSQLCKMAGQEGVGIS